MKNDIYGDIMGFVHKLESKSNMHKMAVKGAKIIKKRTQTGGLDFNDSKFKELKPATIKAKIRNERKQPSKSRLTDTGDMLNSIMGEGIKRGLGLIFLRDSEMEKRLEYNKENGREFLGFSSGDEKKLTNFIRDLFRKIAKLEV